MEQVYKKQELIKKLENLKQQKEENYKNYLVGFDEEFKTHTEQRIKETPLLLSMFKKFLQEVYRPSRIYKLAIKTKNMIKEDLLKTLNDEQKDKIEQLQLCEDRILEDIIEQAFIYGYATAVELREEAIEHYFPWRKKK